MGDMQQGVEGEGWPEGWKEGVVVPVLKKGAGEKVEDYRGIRLTQTAYKVYASVMAERLREEVEGGGIAATESNGVQERGRMYGQRVCAELSRK